MHFHIITLFPQSFDSYINESIIKRAQEDKKIKISFYNPRDFSKERFKHVDQKPYGGGPGMVIQALPVISAIASAQKTIARKKKKAKTGIFFFSPGGTQFDTTYAKKSARAYTDIILVCGRYEGIDARVKKVFRMKEISVGPYVLTGGELPALVVLDTISRQVPGVLGNFSSLEEERISSHDVYTRPEVIEYKGKKYKVPKVLLSGNHKKIEEWKLKGK
jgi:tRNA (guanine37-N1)-methyltransferase